MGGAETIRIHKRQSHKPITSRPPHYQNVNRSMAGVNSNAAGVIDLGRLKGQQRSRR